MRYKLTLSILLFCFFAFAANVFASRVEEVEFENTPLNPDGFAVIYRGNATDHLMFVDDDNTTPGISLESLTAAGSPPGATTQVIFNLAGAFAADAGMTYTSATNALVLTGPITAQTNLSAGLYIYHYGDPDTFFHFDTDMTTLTCGGLKMWAAEENAASQDEFIVNPGDANIDFIVKDDLGNEALKVQGLDGAVSTVGGFTVGTDVTATDDLISGDDTNVGGLLTVAETATVVGNILTTGSYYMDSAEWMHNKGAATNVSVGKDAGSSLSAGSENTNIGSKAGENNASGSYNVHVGSRAGQANLGSGSVFIGRMAGVLSNGTGTRGHVAVGFRALNSANNASTYNTVMGYESGYGITGGDKNTCLGSKAGHNLTTANNCTIIGANNDATSATADNQLDIDDTIFGDTSTGYVAIGTTVTNTAQFVVEGDMRMGAVTTNYTEVEADGDVNFVGDGGMQFAEIYKDGLGGVTITTQSVPAQSMAFSQNGESNGSCEPRWSYFDILIGEDGIYFVSFSASITSSAGEKVYVVQIKKNNGGTGFANLKTTWDNVTANDICPIHISGFIPLSATDTLEVWVQNNTDTTNVSFYNSVLSTFQVGG